MARHPENEMLSGVIAFRPEASLIYVNAESVLEEVRSRIAATSRLRMVICDLSASPFVDLAGSRALHELYEELAPRGIALRIVGAHSRARDLLRADGVGEKTGGVHRTVTLESLMQEQPEHSSALSRPNAP
jgi:sulfate permease, SulP family